MGKLIALIAVIAVYIWDDILLGAPVAFVAGSWGVIPAFLVSAVLYGTVSYGITLVLVVQSQESSPNKLSNWLQRLRDGSHGELSRKLLHIGGGVGFFLSSWLGGGILTTYLFKTAGYEGNLNRLAVASNAIFAVMFCAQYAGLGLLLKELIVNTT